MFVPSNAPLTSQYHMQRQQASGFYHYYSALQPYIPFQSFTSHLQIVNVEITGAIIIERQFDMLCKCTTIQAISHPLLSALAVRTANQTKLPALHSDPNLVPFLSSMGSRPVSWYTQDLPFMNKTSWPKLYAASQIKTTKSAASSNRATNNTPTPGPKSQFISYAGAA